ncbi:unnamed protein product [Linum trigynum]|uniref:Uncharacterized protein n=1 Tax=Linum trigynum TaxID=586398 RepID=A0AAV2CXP6_9ROSI
MASTAQAKAELYDKIADVRALVHNHIDQLQELMARAEGHSQQFVTLTTRLDGMEACSVTRFTEMEAPLDNHFGKFTQDLRGML